MSSSDMARSPAGVAALPIPRRFADIFSVIGTSALESFFKFGKSRRVIGKEAFRFFFYAASFDNFEYSRPKAKHAGKRKNGADGVRSGVKPGCKCQIGFPGKKRYNKGSCNKQRKQHIHETHLLIKFFLLYLLINCNNYDKINTESEKTEDFYMSYADEKFKENCRDIFEKRSLGYGF